MKSRNWYGFGLAIVTIALAMSQTAFASDGRPGRDTLAAMGLGGMVEMSDQEAMKVRGKAAFVFGGSFAFVNTPFGSDASLDVYGSTGRYVAVGGSFSRANVSVNLPGFSASATTQARGGAFAFGF